MMKNNKKGFTLIELLAVIVILAVLILLAMPAVLRMMERAQRNAFTVEANEVIRSAQTAFTEQSIAQGLTQICFSLQSLKDEGYLDKSITKYSGSVSVNLATSTDGEGKTIYLPEIKLWLSNGAYYFENVTSEAIKDATTIAQAGSKTVSNNCGK